MAMSLPSGRLEVDVPEHGLRVVRDGQVVDLDRGRWAGQGGLGGGDHGAASVRSAVSASTIVSTLWRTMPS